MSSTGCLPDRMAATMSGQAHNWRDRLIGGISVADLARELGLDDGEIRKWIARLCGAGSPQPFEADYPEGFQVGQSRAAVLLGD